MTLIDVAPADQVNRTTSLLRISLCCKSNGQMMRASPLPRSPLLSDTPCCRPFTRSLKLVRVLLRPNPRFACKSLNDASVTGSSGNEQLRITTRKVLKQLSSLNLAIVELAAIAGLSSIGTIIEQNKPVEFYVQNYPGEACCCLGLMINK